MNTLIYISLISTFVMGCILIYVGFNPNKEKDQEYLIDILKDMKEITEKLEQTHKDNKI